MTRDIIDNQVTSEDKVPDKLSAEDRKQVQEQIAVLEEQLSNPDKLKVGESLQGREQLNTQIRNKKNILHRDDDLIARGSDKDRVVKRLKEIREIVLKDMLTKTEKRLEEKQDGFQEAVSKNIRFYNLHSKLLKEYQQLCYRLEPYDPEAGSIEKFRPN